MLMYVGIGIAVLFLIIVLSLSYVKAPPDMAYIISGSHKKPRILIGKAGIRIPFLERLDKLALGAIQIDVKTRTSVPTAEYINIKVDSTVSVKVGSTPEMITLASQNFLNVNRETIASKINDLLEGNIREIVGDMKLTDMVSNRKLFSEKVQANVVPDLARFGLELVSFNVQNFIDDNDVITNLGIDNVEQIRKDAAVAKSNAQKEIAIAAAENEKLANDAKVAAATEIAQKETEFAIRKAELQAQADAEQAKADAAKEIEAENQRKIQEIATAEANLAKQEKELELKEREVAIKEKALDAEVRKTAEAQKFAEQQKADAMLYATQKASEAELFERERKAEAERIEAEKQAEAKKLMAAALQAEGEARAAAAKAQGLAEAEAIKAKAEAEAEGMLKKAEAMERYGESARMNMQIEALKVYFEQLPEIAKAVGDGYQGVDKIVMLGGDSNQLAGNILNTTTQISESLSESMGIDLKALLSGVLGGKIAQN